MKFEKMFKIWREILGLVLLIFIYVGVQYLTLHAIQQTFSQKRDTDAQVREYHKNVLIRNNIETYKETIRPQDSATEDLPALGI